MGTVSNGSPLEDPGDRPVGLFLAWPAAGDALPHQPGPTSLTQADPAQMLVVLVFLPPPPPLFFFSFPLPFSPDQFHQVRISEVMGDGHVAVGELAHVAVDAAADGLALRQAASRPLAAI